MTEKPMSGKWFPCQRKRRRSGNERKGWPERAGRAESHGRYQTRFKEVLFPLLG
jgi:hypothetical protein